jgi:branched-chain amino acid transport system permease protein
MGLSVIQMKMLVSGLAAFVAGVGGGVYALSFKQAIPLDYATILGLAWLAVLVTFGVRSNIAALLAGLLFTFSPAFIQTVLKLDAPWSSLPILLFGLGAIALAKNPEGTVHQQAMGFQRMLHKASGGGARPVPAGTAFAGRHDPRLDHDDDPPPSSEPSQPDGTTAEVAGS